MKEDKKMKREKQTDIYETINYKKTKNAVQQVMKILDMQEQIQITMQNSMEKHGE